MELADFEFKRERKLGEFVQDFINLLKMIIGHLGKVMFKMLSLPICGMLLVGYYLSTQFNMQVNYSSGELFRVISSLLTAFGLMFVIGTLAFGFAIEYFIILRDRRRLDFDEKDVWQQFRENLGKYFRFLIAAIIVAILAFIPLSILVFACMFVPFVGSIAMGVLFAIVGLWFFTAFMLYREGYYELIDTFNGAYGLLKSKIFEYGLASYVVSFLFQSLLYLISLMPTVIIGLIAYNSVGFNENFFETSFGKILVSVGGSVMTIFFIVYNMLSVLSYGIIYETGKEMVFGENVFERITKIGRRSGA
ncbi:MAG TPA: ABC transporter permease [Sphingobacterium sp.]|nr:ABC transporter permease [Sphingobacterium sp.]